MVKDNYKKKRPSIVIIIIFFIGFFILLYPLISRTYYDYRGNEEVASFEEGLEDIPSKEIQDRLQLGHAYNSALLSGDTTPLDDPYSDEDKEEGIAEYARMLEINEKLGTVTIPKINTKFPMYAGTNETVLQKGVGHLEGTSLPIGGLNTNSVLTAHRGLPENKLFTDLDEMALGDLFFVETIAGELAYEVVDIKVIEPTEIEEVSIQEGKDLVTLLTCTPYMINSHRLLVIGERTEIPAEAQEELTDISWFEHMLSLLSEYKWLIIILVIVIIVATIKMINKKRRNK